MSQRALRDCFKALGIDNGDALKECDNFEMEFTYVKKIYHTKILLVHPDKGGSVAEFREVRTSWDAIKKVFDSHKVQTFVKIFAAKASTKKSSSSAKKKSEKKSDDNDESSAEDKGYEEFDWEDLQRSFDENAQPSYDFYQEAESEETPTYRVEPARSGRSGCKAKNCAREVIAQGDLRVGSFNKETGSYGRWVHVTPCWRVPSKLWKGLEQLGNHDTIADVDPARVANALESMNDILFCGFLELDEQQKMKIVNHVMDSSTWAAYRKPKAKKMVADGGAGEGGDGTNLNSSSNTSYGSASMVPISSSTTVTKAKQRYEPPVPGKNNALENALSGKTVVMTGIFPELGGGAGLSLGKDKMKAILVSFGARVTGSVSGQTDILMTGTAPGASKVSQARRQPKCQLMTSHDLKLGLETGTAIEDWAAEVPELIIDSFSKGFAFGAGEFKGGNAIEMSKEERDIAKGLKKAPVQIKAARAKPGTSAKARSKVKNSYEEEEDDDDDDDDDDDGDDEAEYKPRARTSRKRKASTKTEPKEEEEEEEEEEGDADYDGEVEEDILPDVAAFDISCDRCGNDCSHESFALSATDEDLCPTCYEDCGRDDGDFPRFGVSVEVVDETAVALHVGKGKAKGKPRPKAKPKAKPRAKPKAKAGPAKKKAKK